MHIHSLWILFLLFVKLSLSIPKDYSKKPGVSTFRFAKDISARNYRKQEKCDVDVVLNWKQELQSSCLSTPIIYPFFKSESNDIVVSTFWQYVDIVNSDGHIPKGWPHTLQDEIFYTSPIVYDIDNSGTEDIIVVNSNGEIHVLHVSSHQTVQFPEVYSLPDLSIHRQWFELPPDPSHPHNFTSILLPLNVSSLFLTRNASSIAATTQQRKSQRAKLQLREKQLFIQLDPHVLANAGRFIDHGHLVLTLPVSYYLSERDYPAGIQGIAMEKYLACGVTAVDLTENRIRWAQIYGVSTMHRQSFIYSTPISVDLEGMGTLTTLFGTSQGDLFAVDQHGKPRRGFPVRFNEIRMGVVCADVANDAYLEIIVGDMSGILAVLDQKGEEIWSLTLSGPLSQSVMTADVDGDGNLDVIAVTDNGDIWILNGQTGKSLANYPIRTGYQFRSTPTLIDVSPKGDGLHLVFTSKEGEVGIVNLLTGCVRRIDVGEELLTRVLASKDKESDLLALIVSTMNGNLLQFTTSGTWSQVNRFNNRGYNSDAIYPPHFITLTFGSGSELWWEIMQTQVRLPITIKDSRYRKYDPFYRVQVYRRGELLCEQVFKKEGSYVLEFELLETGYYNIQVVLENEHKQIVERVIPIHANVEALNYVKWLVLIPFLLISTILMLSSSFGTPLPL